MQHWPEHKVWHKEQKNTYARVTFDPDSDQRVEELLASDQKLNVIVGQAESLRLKGKHLRAVKKWKEAITLEPNSADYHTGLAMVYKDANDLPHALNAYLLTCDGPL
eukprot:3582968-Prymnesium_polylepis.2